MSYPRRLGFALLVVSLLVACSSSDGEPAATASSDASSCQVLASSYDRSCQLNTDCVLVPPGGNTCDPCSTGTGYFACDLASVNAASSAAFKKALSDGLAPLYGTKQYMQCVFASCPSEGIARCEAGVCTMTN